MRLNKIRIDETEIPVYEKHIRCEDADFGYSEEQTVYEFLSPRADLNQENLRRYAESSDRPEKNLLLGKIPVGNILSMSKSPGYRLDKAQEIIEDLAVKPKTSFLKESP